jgi:endoglucanase
MTASLRRACLAACVSVIAMTIFQHAAPAQQPNSTAQRCEPWLEAGVPRERLALLARGFNLTGWMDGPTVRRPDLKVLASLRRRGFSHIRLPVTPEYLMEAFSIPDDVRRNFAELDRAIDSLIALGFAVSLDLHPGGKLGPLHIAEPERAYDLIDSLWHKLARRYANRPAERLFFEVLNEPGVAPEIWNRQGPRLAETIRSEAPDHTIVYGPANYQRIDALAEITPLALSNVVYAAHFYDPMIFTHQGLDWSEGPLRYLHGVPFPARASDPAVVGLLQELRMMGRDTSAALLKKDIAQPWTAERIDAEIAEAAAWSGRYRRPVIINEFGVLGWKAPAEDRARWLQAVRRAAESHCIGWAHWEYADGFGFVRRIGDREVPDEALVRALLGDRS